MRCSEARESLVLDPCLLRNEERVARTADTASSASALFGSKGCSLVGVDSVHSTELYWGDCWNDEGQMLTLSAVVVDGPLASPK